MSQRIKSKTRDSALPRRRSAPALALQSPRHRQRVIPDKRRASNERELRTHIRETEHRAPLAFNEDTLDRERPLADDLRLEGAALNRLVIAATAPKSMSLDMARKLSARMINTLCSKIGAAQWTCTKDECTCHLKETIK